MNTSKSKMRCKIREEIKNLIESAKRLDGMSEHTMERYAYRNFDDYVQEFDEICKSRVLYSVMMWWKATEKQMWENYAEIVRDPSFTRTERVQYAVMCGTVKEYVTNFIHDTWDWDAILDWDRLGASETCCLFDIKESLYDIAETICDTSDDDPCHWDIPD